MSEKIKVKIITPEHTVFEGEADLVVVPGSDGDVGFQPLHISCLYALTCGELRLVNDKHLDRFAVHGGFATFRFDNLEILTDAAEHAKDIDVERALIAMQRAKERLPSLITDNEISRAEVAIKKALTRLNVAEYSI